MVPEIFPVSPCPNTDPESTNRITIARGVIRKLVSDSLSNIQISFVSASIFGGLARIIELGNPGRTGEQANSLRYTKRRNRLVVENTRAFQEFSDYVCKVRG